jgi:cell division protein FtsI/penicillin-binding protein 2
MEKEFQSRIRALKILFGGILLIFGVRLFDLQILQYDDFAAEAKSQHEKKSVLPARRGKIFVKKNYLSDDLVPLATNNTLQMMFIDPVVLNYPNFNKNLPISEQKKTGNPAKAAELLAPLLINSHCEETDGCQIKVDAENLSSLEQKAIEIYQKELEKIFFEIEKTEVIIFTDIAKLRGEQILELKLRGVYIKNNNVIIDPTQISSPEDVASQISPLLGLDKEKVAKSIVRRVKRYVEIVHKIVPEISEKIIKLKKDPKFREILRGIQLRDEHWRYYPEKQLASQVLGFVDSSKIGQYGIEGRFDSDLKGKAGEILGSTNTRGQRIFGKDFTLKKAQDGSDVVLSIDRVVQGEVERILQEDLQDFRADFGQVIVVNPETGEIIAMANAPSFNPNKFSDIFTKYEIDPNQESADREDETFNKRIPTITIDNKFYRYFNTWGPFVFRNKIITDEYEPGSVIKALTMSAAINSDEVSPQTTYNDNGPIEVDSFEIKNADEIYDGDTTMIEVINRSLNTGIAFITRKMGKQLFYEYLKNFGFGQYTDIELDGEVKGKLEFWQDWAESELITRGYGQGFTASPLQVAMAFSSLANGGYLMKPLLVKEIRHPDGKIEKFNSERVRRIISEKTYQTIKAMLLNSVDNGVARGARIPGYTVMGKTGTSQTYRNGKALRGEGTTITSFAGFSPIKHPKFVILVKYDHPQKSQWGSETAARTFRKVTKFLLSYYKIPPDR